MSTSNKDRAIKFLELASGGHVEEAYSQFVSQTFIHHNAWCDAGRQTLKQGMMDAAAACPHQTIRIHQVLEEGDRVMTHSLVKPSPEHQGIVVVHILRFSEGMIVELWDVVMVVPEHRAGDVDGLF